MLPSAVHQRVVNQQLIHEAAFTVDRSFHPSAIEPQTSQDQDVIEAEIAFDAEIARIDESVDHRAVDHERIVEIEASEIECGLIETGATPFVAEYRPQNPDAGRSDLDLLLRGDPLYDAGPK